MKLLTFVGAGALTLIVVSSVVFFLANPNRLDPEDPQGKIRYYTRIANADPKIDGNQRYAYEIDAYDEKGKEKALLFTSSRPLRKGAYLGCMCREFGASLTGMKYRLRLCRNESKAFIYRRAAYHMSSWKEIACKRR